MNTEARMYMYNKSNDEVETIIIWAKDAEAWNKMGWLPSPSKFHVENGSNPQFISMCDTVCHVTNLMVNLHLCTDKDTLVDIANNFFKLDMPKRRSIKSFKYYIGQAAKKAGLFDGGEVTELPDLAEYA